MDSENIYLCAINEGDMYQTWLGLARDQASNTLWRNAVYTYTQRLFKEGRCGYREIRQWVRNVAVARLMDYYKRHLEET